MLNANFIQSSNLLKRQHRFVVGAGTGAGAGLYVMYNMCRFIWMVWLRYYRNLEHSQTCYQKWKWPKFLTYEYLGWLFFDLPRILFTLHATPPHHIPSQPIPSWYTKYHPDRFRAYLNGAHGLLCLCVCWWWLLCDVYKVLVMCFNAMLTFSSMSTITC